MYPARQLEALALREQLVRGRIAVRRTRMVLAARQAGHPWRWVGRNVLRWWLHAPPPGGPAGSPLEGLAWGWLGRVAPTWTRTLRWGATLSRTLGALWGKRSGAAGSRRR